MCTHRLSLLNNKANYLFAMIKKVSSETRGNVNFEVSFNSLDPNVHCAGYVQLNWFSSGRVTYYMLSITRALCNEKKKKTLKDSYRACSRFSGSLWASLAPTP